MKLYVITCVFLLHLTSLVLSRGLREEFTWTRLNYVWPRNRVQRHTSESGRAGYSRGSMSPILRHVREQAGDIAFPDENDEQSDVSTGQSETGNRHGGGGYGGNRPRPTGRPSGRPSRRPGRPNANLQDTTGQNGDIPYDYVTNIPMGANRWRNKLFITVPRRRLGVPSTLNYVKIDGRERHNVPLIPYPDWETNLQQSRTGSTHNRNQVTLTSVYRVAVDPCDRLWVVDTGVIELPGNATRIQPSQIVIYDLKTDQVIRKFQFPTSQLTPNTYLALVTVDTTPETCQDAYAYFPDLGGYHLIVYSFRQDRSWRVSHNYFYLEPLAGEFAVAGHEFQWNDGIFSIALSDVKEDGYRDAYFHSLAGTHLYAVSTEILQNETLATRSYHGNDFKIVGDRLDGSQTSASDLHQPSSVLFLGLVNQNALACWNTNRPLRDISIVQKDDQKMIYPCDVKIYEDEVILLTNTMPGFLYGNLDYDEVNFRVWMEDVSTAIAGTKCVARRGGGGGGSYS